MPGGVGSQIIQNLDGMAGDSKGELGVAEMATS